MITHDKNYRGAQSTKTNRHYNCDLKHFNKTLTFRCNDARNILKVIIHELKRYIYKTNGNTIAYRKEKEKKGE